MLVEVLMSLVLSLATYIMVSTITNQQAQETQNYFKEQLNANEENNKFRLTQIQDNFLNETKSLKADLINEIKQQGEKNKWS